MSKTMKDFDREGMLVLAQNEMAANRFILATSIIAFSKLSPSGQEQVVTDMQRIVDGYHL